VPIFDLRNSDWPLWTTRTSAFKIFRECVLAMAILSVRPSRSGTDSRPGEIESRSSPYDSLESLVSYEVLWCQWMRRFPSNEGLKEGTPPQKSLFYHY